MVILLFVDRTDQKMQERDKRQKDRCLARVWKAYESSSESMKLCTHKLKD